VTVAKTFTAGSATLPETGTSDSPAIYMLALLTSVLAFFGLKKKEESK
jgi:5'-nucleotidase family protein